MQTNKIAKPSTHLSSSRAEVANELNSIDLITRSQRSACLSNSVMDSDGDKPPSDGCRSCAISSDTTVTLDSE